MEHKQYRFIVNPTDTQRYQILSDALLQAGRPEDLQNIIELLNPPPDITSYASPGEFKNLKIGVLGAGLAGLSAAFELRKLGADIKVFEAGENRIGGKVYTHYFDKNQKFYGEMGPMRIPVSHGTTWHYINLFNLITVPMTSPLSNNFIYVHNNRIRKDFDGKNITEELYPLYNISFDDKNLNWKELNEFAYSYVLKNMSPETRKELLQILPAYNSEYAMYTRLSNRQLFEMLGLSQETISLLSSMNPITGGLIDTSYDETLQEEYTLDYTNSYRISGGMTYLPFAFFESLTSKNPSEYNLPSDDIGYVEIKQGHSVTGIYQAPKQDSVILKYDTKSSKDNFEVFDYIICTLPFTTLRGIDIKPFFQNQKMQAIRELNYCDSMKSVFLCKKRFWEMDTDYGNINGGISFTDLPIQSVVYPSDHLNCPPDSLCSPEDPGVLTAAYGLNKNAIEIGNINDFNQHDFIKQNVEELHGLPPGYLDKIVQDYKTVDWFHEEWARGAFAVNLPGQKVNFAYTILEPEFNNRIFFAGDHTSTKHGWMQGALQSGMLAANILAYNKKMNDQEIVSE